MTAICENRQSLVDTEHHRGLIDVVFNSLKGEVIADLLYAWTIGNNPLEPEHTSLLNICAGHLVIVHNLVSFSPRYGDLLYTLLSPLFTRGLREQGWRDLLEC